jgi:hypothetical protein
MKAEGSTTIHQALLLRHAEATRDLGPALWAALREVEALFRLAPMGPEFRRHYLGAEVPEALRGEVGDGRAAAESAVRDEAWWDSARGSISHTYDQRKLGEMAWELLGAAREGGFLLLVTDVEIVPPKGWRYIIWGDCLDGTVVSAAPTDPNYWEYYDPHRTMTVKHRVRSACCSVVGEVMGLNRCNNPACFLYSDVESARVLDRMICMGGEHRVKPLTRRGFMTKTADPARVQEVIQYPTSTIGRA